MEASGNQSPTRASTPLAGADTSFAGLLGNDGHPLGAEARVVEDAALVEAASENVLAGNPDVVLAETPLRVDSSAVADTADVSAAAAQDQVAIEETISPASSGDTPVAILDVVAEDRSDEPLVLDESNAISSVGAPPSVVNSSARVAARSAYADSDQSESAGEQSLLVPKTESSRNRKKHPIRGIVSNAARSTYGFLGECTGWVSPLYRKAAPVGTFVYDLAKEGSMLYLLLAFNDGGQFHTQVSSTLLTWAAGLNILHGLFGKMARAEDPNRIINVATNAASGGAAAQITQLVPTTMDPTTLLALGLSLDGAKGLIEISQDVHRKNYATGATDLVYGASKIWQTAVFVTHAFQGQSVGGLSSAVTAGMFAVGSTALKPLAVYIDGVLKGFASMPDPDAAQTAAAKNSV